MKKTFLTSATAVAALVLLFASCKKNDSSSTPPANANIMLVNASPGDSVGSDFYLNDVKFSTQAVKYPSNSGYLSVAPKTYTVKVTAANNINPVASGSYNFDAGKNYSVFAYDTLQSGKIKLFAVQDDISAPASGKSKVRFLHLSPVNIAVDIYANDSLVFANRSYADNISDNSKANFISVNAGTYNVKVRFAGSSSTIPPLVSLDNISFAGGNVYTIFARGTVNGKGVNVLGAEVITNK